MTLTSQPASVARQLSVRSIMETLLRQGPVSRAELARLTGLSKQTATEVVRVLESGGWIRPDGQTQGALGRSAVTYTLETRAAFVAGIDLGGTKIRLALADLAGTVVGEAVEPTDRRGGEHVITQIGALTDRVAAQADMPAGALRGATLGCPGVLEPATGAVTIAPNIPGFDRLDVLRVLEERLGCPVSVENDVNLAAKGEQWQGCCQDVRDFAFIALGTGVGMGIVANGQLLRGAGGAAGEIAYLPLGGDPFDSRGYRYGTLETALSSEALLGRYRGFGGTGAQDVRGIFDCLGEGDAAAAATMDEAARLLVQALMAVRALLDPARIVLGGSVGARVELAERVRALAARYMRSPMPIDTSALGSRAAVVGAVGMALTRLHAGLFGLSDLPHDSRLPAAPALPVPA
ncbi:ROK family transcriptional regulator [Roseomonas marmotae]|uniref:ROK family transcriptional regulator n=1 Tax=Roseomonas marmotae TaxID=2768161 RepID=A0ABS3KHU3_9PROT|nr:ROK family transcriptional regulator [Roseomonas marmotae]MBO1077035.1 ROK family transcriptional regulator [Roseomonas marmotae]QTI78431.1 ROK family transcriptional regulator [Roseomonas marmotae]